FVPRKKSAGRRSVSLRSARPTVSWGELRGRFRIGFPIVKTTDAISRGRRQHDLRSGTIRSNSEMTNWGRRRADFVLWEMGLRAVLCHKSLIGLAFRSEFSHLAILKRAGSNCALHDRGHMLSAG